MSQITDWAAQEQADLAGIATALTNIATGIAALDAAITAFQNSPGTLSAADQAALNAIQAQGKTLLAQAQAINTTEPTPATAPAITVQPASQSVATGSAATLSVGATGSDPLTYQWSLNGVVIAGATSATLSIASAAATDAGTYTVVVTNSVGSVTSSPAVLTVT